VPRGRGDIAPARLRGVAIVDAAGTRIGKPRIAAAHLRRIALRILAQTPLCSVATVAPDGSAHVNTAYFCYSDALELFFLSHPASKHCRNLAANGSAAIAVFDSRQRWGGPDRGLQLFGTCSAAEGERAARLYSARFPRYAKWVARQGAAGAAKDYRFFRVACTQFKLLDERELGGARFVVADVARRS
jgi:uncharacterized protein YhbP (UPF0306 family)